MGNILYCPGNHTSFGKSIVRISDVLSLLSQKLNLENNRTSRKDGVGGREGPDFIPSSPFLLCVYVKRILIPEVTKTR